MKRAREARVLALSAVLACVAVTAFAQGRQPWADPPPSSPPILREAGPALPVEEGPTSDGTSLPRRTPYDGTSGVQRLDRRPPSPLGSTRPPADAVPAQRDAALNSGERRLLPEAPISPSFSCRAARTQVERAICADPVLAAKDQRMAILYEQAGGSRRGPVDPTQWRWLAARNGCARLTSSILRSCINSIYDARIAELLRN
jgi:hypothetical protein